MCFIAQGHVSVYGRGCKTLLTEWFFLALFSIFLWVALDFIFSTEEIEVGKNKHEYFNVLCTITLEN